MKNLRQLCVAAVLTFVLTISAPALGIMDQGVDGEAVAAPTTENVNIVEDSIVEDIFNFIQSLF